MTWELWWILMRACMALGLIGVVGSWYMEKLRDALGGEAAVGGSFAFVFMGALGVGGAAGLLRMRPDRVRGPALKVMSCGGTMSAASFKSGSNYGICSARCTHSRADFEARR
jgi:hypothetical protein